MILPPPPCWIIFRAACCEHKKTLFKLVRRMKSQSSSGKGTRNLGGREVECLDLPRPVLEKFYHGNAQRLMPGLKDNQAL